MVYSVRSLFLSDIRRQQRCTHSLKIVKSKFQNSKTNTTFSKIKKKMSERMTQGKQDPNIEEICALGSEIIATGTDD